jgi:hypothetical protein
MAGAVNLHDRISFIAMPSFGEQSMGAQSVGVQSVGMQRVGACAVPCQRTIAEPLFRFRSPFRSKVIKIPTK